MIDQEISYEFYFLSVFAVHTQYLVVVVSFKRKM